VPKWPSIPRRPPSLALALQGGGAHGAFTWGVLDALLEHSDIAIEALSGTSAGAMNAVVMAHGLLAGGRDGARQALAQFWHAVGNQPAFDWLTQGEGSTTTLTPAARWWMGWSQQLSPYQRMGPAADPLRAILAEQVDFDRLRGQGTLRLFIAATQANSGRLRLFSTPELSIDAVLASACLPTLQRAVLIDGEPYWDGGFSANPAVSPLIYGSRATDVLVVMLSPWSFGDLPTTAADIRLRAMDIGFNAAFLREMRALAENSAVARQRWWRSGSDARLARLHWHLIDGHETLASLSNHSRMIAHRPFLDHLREAGHARTLAWLDRHGPMIGRRSSADLHALFSSDAPPAGPIPADTPLASAANPPA
jgi:NTE family protein